MSGEWVFKGLLKDYEPDEVKPLTNKLEVPVTITDDSSGTSSNITISGFDGVENFMLTGKRYGAHFFARTDAPDKSKFVSGKAVIVKKTGIASTFTGFAVFFDDVSIGEVRCVGKRVNP
jgi:hypothetical protein